ncbi:MAG TPA: histidine kinase dimerization/phosphoacceptor domain -containing protein [Ignavibacteriaceae bacterium]|nr:histidine kinase dimerization/phosphoacceptor domain -containing protein [Ignavibacteriaceae bacterium]
MNKISFAQVFSGAIVGLVLVILISLLTDFRLFSGEGFIPRALCGEWTTGLITLHNFSDFFIWASYLAIPIVLIKFANKRVHELPFPHLFWLFGLFIVACGTTHLIEIILFYNPVYRLSGVVKLFTAAASIGTVFALVKVIPQALAMKSPESMQAEINERKKVELQLRERERQLSEAQKIAKIGSWGWDIEKDMVTWSDELYRIFGKNQDQPISFESYLQSIHPDYREQTKEIILGAVQIKKPFEFYEKIIRPDGLERILHCQGEVLINTEGKATGLIGTSQDVTTSKLQEEELRRTKDELEIRVIERTRELLKVNEELQKEILERKKAIEITESALREKEILLKEVHHRVKNNLQIISILISLQSNQTNDKKMIDFFGQTKNRIKSIALVHEKLYKSKDISRINFEEYLNELIPNIYESFKTESSNVSLRLEIDKIFISTDVAISLALMINELATNSLKYAFPNDRKGELFISLKQE